MSTQRSRVLMTTVGRHLHTRQVGLNACLLGRSTCRRRAGLREVGNNVQPKLLYADVRSSIMLYQTFLYLASELHCLSPESR